MSGGRFSKMCGLLVILIGVMLIAGCREEGGPSSIYSGDYTGGSGETAAASVDVNPEPSTLALFGMGLAGLAYSMFRRRKV